MFAWKLGAYVALLVIAVTGTIVLWISYGRNASYLADVAVDVATLEAIAPAADAAPLDQQLPRLDALRRVSDSANRYQDDPPWAMRWGLFQGQSLGDAARDAYSRELIRVLLPVMTSRLEERIVAYASEPLIMYEYLKAYLMLGDLSRRDISYLEVIAGEEWKAAYPADPNLGSVFAGHFRALLDNVDLLPATPIDQSVVKRARTTLKQVSIPLLVYQNVRWNYSRDSAIRFDTDLGSGASEVFVRKSDANFSQPIPRIYTLEAFKEITARNSALILKQFAEDYWVWGEQPPSAVASASLLRQVIDIYEKDYIAAWDGILGDIALVPLRSPNDTKRALTILASTTSPLREFLRLVDQHTFLTEPPASGNSPSTTRERFGIVLGRTAEPAESRMDPAGAQVTAHFADVHRLVTASGGAAPIDNLLLTLATIGKKLGPPGDRVGAMPPDPESVRQIGELTTSLKWEAALLPPAIRVIVDRIADSSLAAARGPANTR